MPAGNDAKAASSELADEFGAGAGRADALIKASRSRYDDGLGAAQLKNAEPVEVDLADLSKASGVDKDAIRSYAVRGEDVVYTYEQSDGRLTKGLVSRSALSSSEAATTAAPKRKKAKKKPEPTQIVEEAPAEAPVEDAPAAE